MDDVPDLRMVGTRLVNAVVAVVLAVASAIAIAMQFPNDDGKREASAFAPAFLVLAIAGVLAGAWYALFDVIRRRLRPGTEHIPAARARHRRGARLTVRRAPQHRR